MSQLFVSLLVVLQLLFRGDTTVVTYATGREKVRKHCCYTDSGQERCIVLRCRQYCHYVKYDRWYLRDRSYNTYIVEMVKVDDDVYKDYHVGHYPQLCTSLLNTTDYPMNCAISAHLDMILQK